MAAVMVDAVVVVVVLGVVEVTAGITSGGG